MIDIARYRRIRRHHGGHGSWAVWAEPSSGPKSNIGDLGILDPRVNDRLLGTLRADVVMIGLNISRPFSEPFRNFHDKNPRANDYKIRFAFAGTRYYGAYMTDIIKDLPMVDSAALLNRLKTEPGLIRKNVDLLRRELGFLGAEAPLLLAFGHAAYSLLANNLAAGERSGLIKLTHYAHWMGQERYREKVLGEIGAAAARM